MDVYMLTCFSILLLTSIQIGQNLAIHIEIHPETYVKTLNDEINITCTPDGVDDLAKETVLMEIVKDGQPIVIIRRGLQPSFPNGGQKRFVVTGHINKNVSLSHLSLTLENFKSSDAGQYSCVMYFVDEIGLIKMEKSSLNLTEERLDMKSLENVLKVMKDNVNDLKKKVAGLSDKVTSTSAFSATNLKSHINTQSGKILVLPDIIMQQGAGYDPNTGVYTAPRNGLYVFHVVVRTSSGCHYFNLDLMANDKVLARLAAYIPGGYDQSSISSVVDLKPGDRVFSIMRASGCNLHNSMYTVFTGYLIKAY